MGGGGGLRRVGAAPNAKRGFARDLPFGARLLGGERALFRLWAPGARTAAVEIKGVGVLYMRPEGGGWFACETTARAGALYRFRLDDAYSVPDPASRALEGDVHGWSVLTDPRAYVWRTPDWTGRAFEEVVLYELHAGLLGGFEGVEARLPDLADLGVTAVELMPVADVPGRRNWGYDGVFPFAPDAALGPPEALKSLVDRAHELGLMIFLDVVYNHFGPDGNLLPRYAPDFFRADQTTAWGAAIDFRRAEVKDFFCENALYWLEEYRIDGLRLDAVHAIGDPLALAEIGRRIRAASPEGRRAHLVVENDDNDPELLRGPFDAQWNDDFHHVLHVLLTGETGGYYAAYRDRPAERLARALMEGFVYQGEPSAARDGGPRGAPSADLPPTAFVNFLQNHDQIGNRAFGERLTRLAHPRALEAAIALLLLAPPTPLIFMGEEAGSEDPFLYFTDHEAGLAAAVREGRRAEFKDFPAFADPERLKDIPDPNAEETFAASRPTPSLIGGARRRLYKELLHLRRTRLTPNLKGARPLGARAIGPCGVCAAWRLADGSHWSLAANFGQTPAPLARALKTQPVYEVGRSALGVLGPYSVILAEESLL